MASYLRIERIPITLLARFWNWIVRENDRSWLHVVALTLLVTQVQWGLWRSLDLPIADEAWALLDGFRLARGDADVSISWWNSPLASLSYVPLSMATGSVEATFYAQRFILSLLSVLALYFLLRQIVPSALAWPGAVWWAVSPLLVDLNLDRTDFLAASACAWAALALLKMRSASRVCLSMALAIVSALFHPVFVALVFGILMYLAARFAYLRLRFSTRVKLLLITVSVTILSAMAVASATAVISRHKDVEAYFVYVFSFNRTWDSENLLPNQHLGLWPLFERDFGPDHSIAGILKHPGSLARDMVRNAGALVRLTKQLTTSSVWGTVSLRAARWLVAMLALVSAGIVLIVRDWNSHWRNYAVAREEGWLNLLPLLAFVPVLLFFWPYPFYFIVIVPLMMGPLLLLALAILRRSRLPRAGLVAASILVVLLLAPTPRSTDGVQPIRHLVAYFSKMYDPGAPMRLLGTPAITICPYLSVKGCRCQGQEWDDRGGPRTLESFTDSNTYDYFIYDRWMAQYVQLETSGLSEVLSDRSAQWRQVLDVGDYRVFERIAQK